MGQNCNCVREQGLQPTINLSGGKLGDGQSNNGDNERCESEINPREADEAININIKNPGDKGQRDSYVKIRFLIIYGLAWVLHTKFIS